MNDEAQDKSESTALLGAALDYAARGWRVFPCHTVDSLGACSCRMPGCDHPAKHPLTSHGFQNATCDPLQIKTWWGRWPTANVAIATGRVSGLIVLDIDPRHGGDETLAQLEHAHGSLSETMESLTGGGGRHILFVYPSVLIASRANTLGPGIDVKADGGYIIAPPSLHASGRRYAWEVSHHFEEIMLTPLPGWLLDQLTATKQRANKNPHRDITDEQRATLERAKNALGFIPAVDYAIWLRMGMALHSLHPGEDVFSVWVAWSESCPEKFRLDVCQQKWASFHSDRDNGISIASLFALAKEKGWKSASAFHNGAREGDEEQGTIDSRGRTSPWRFIESAPQYLAREEKEFRGLTKDLLAPGAITLFAAPRGLGKTQTAHALGNALAMGGVFRDEHLQSARVLIVDRDNPDAIIKKRLRAWGAAHAPNLHVLTRQHAPDLKDKAAWAAFPVENYDVVIIDSVGASTEGVTEKEGKQTTEILATVLDLARKGIAILLLSNTIKDGTNLKGRGEWADRADIIYEIRDATGFLPSGKKPWWQELPEAGEASWADRAARRKGQTDFRLAFVCSKFRLGVEPEPFCIELHLPENETWSLCDVTAEIHQAGQETIRAAENLRSVKLKSATEALAKVVKERADLQEPILKTEAESFLKEQHLSQKAARTLITDGDGKRWYIKPLPGKGGPKALFPMGNAASAEDEQRKKDPIEKPDESSAREDGISVAPMDTGDENHDPPEGAKNTELRRESFPSLGKSRATEKNSQNPLSHAASRDRVISVVEEVEKPAAIVFNDAREEELFE